MEEEAKNAYRHLGLTGYTAIQSLSSDLKVGLINVRSADSQNSKIQTITALSKWFGKLMKANVHDFNNFDEEEFWSEHKDICEWYPGYNFEAFRELFEDSLNHLREES